MTFCIAMKVTDGLVGLADTRVTTGAEVTTARKVAIIQHGRHSMFIMTSGLRSVRDKALAYFNEVLEEKDASFDKLYKAVNAFGEQIRRVRQEDREALEEAGLPFNLHCIIGGQLENDPEHKLYLLYPQANWVEVSQGTPYFVIGESSYGKALLDRALKYESGMEMALKIGVVAFDATKKAANDVDYPVDVVLYRPGVFRTVQHRYYAEDLAEVGKWWHEHIVDLIRDLPCEWTHPVLDQLRETTGTI